MALEAFLWDHGIQDDWMKGSTRAPTFQDFDDDKVEETDMDMLNQVQV